MTTGTEGEQLNWGDAILKSGLGAALLAFAIAMLKAAEKFVPFLIAKKMRVDVLAGINELSPVYREMEMAIQKDGATRVLMFSAHNDGGIPSPLTPFYTSVIHVAADTYEHRQRAASYQSIRVDSHYTDMLLRMQRDGCYHFTVGENPTAMLNQFYTAEGVTDSLLCYLGIWNNSFVYCSFATFGRKFNENELVWLKLRGLTIKKMMEDTK